MVIKVLPSGGDFSNLFVEKYYYHDFYKYNV